MRMVWRKIGAKFPNCPRVFTREIRAENWREFALLWRKIGAKISEMVLLTSLRGIAPGSADASIMDTHDLGGLRQRRDTAFLRGKYAVKIR